MSRTERRFLASLWAGFTVFIYLRAAPGGFDALEMACVLGAALNAMLFLFGRATR